MKSINKYLSTKTVKKQNIHDKYCIVVPWANTCDKFEHLYPEAMIMPSDIRGQLLIFVLERKEAKKYSPRDNDIYFYEFPKEYENIYDFRDDYVANNIQVSDLVEIDYNDL